MNRRSDTHDRACPNCGLPDTRRFEAELDAGCDCADCRGGRAREDGRYSFRDDFDDDMDELEGRAYRDVDDDMDDDNGADDGQEADFDDDVDDYDDDGMSEDDDDLEDDLLNEMFEDEDDFEDGDDFDADGEDYEDDEEDLNDFLEEDDFGDDMFDDFDEDAAYLDADDYEDDLLDEDLEDAEFDGFAGNDDEDAFEDQLEDMDRRVVKRPCSGVRRIIVRKNRDGNEPLTDAQRRQICNAVQRARRWAATAEGVFDGIWNQRRRKRQRRIDAWKRNDTVVEWLGRRKLTNRQIRVTRRRVRRIRDYLQTGLRVVVVQHNTGKRSYLCGTANAYYTGDRRVYLCPNFFGRGRSAQARTIIHELVHRLGWAHARLKGFGPVSSTADHTNQARALARRFPLRARRNPVNIAWLFSDL